MKRIDLLTRFALAAGLSSACGVRAEQKAFDDFAEDEADLRCEIAALCGEDSEWVCESPQTHDFDRCDSFNDDQADHCLGELQNLLDQLEMASPEDIAGLCTETSQILSCFPVTDGDPAGAGSCSTSIPGRPIRDADGRPCLPRSHIGPGRVDADHPWSLDDAAREAAALRWLHDAGLEHASVAAFARISLDLLAHGAPPELLAAAYQAALDEIRHAQLCLDLARSLGGRDVRLGELPLPAFEPASLERIAVEALLEGAVGETTAALIAHEATSQADAPARRVCEIIADDELRHAELAWATIAWALRRDPTLAPVLVATLRQRRASLTHADWPGEPIAGIVSGETASRIERRVIEEIVGPLLRELCSELESSSPASFRPSSSP